jgi:hypothetical protein
LVVPQFDIWVSNDDDDEPKEEAHEELSIATI